MPSNTPWVSYLQWQRSAFSKEWHFRSGTPSQRFDHWYHCTRCGSASFHNRHECVLQALVATSLHHNVVVKKYLQNMPVPGKIKGGADFLLMPTNTTLKGCTLVGDVAVTSMARMGSVSSAKINQYKQFSPAMGATTLPCVLGHQCTLAGQSLGKQQTFCNRPICRRHTYIRDIAINCQFALIKQGSFCVIQSSKRPDS